MQFHSQFWPHCAGHCAETCHFLMDLSEKLAFSSFFLLFPSSQGNPPTFSHFIESRTFRIRSIEVRCNTEIESGIFWLRMQYNIVVVWNLNYLVDKFNSLCFPGSHICIHILFAELLCFYWEFQHYDQFYWNVV